MSAHDVRRNIPSLPFVPWAGYCFALVATLAFLLVRISITAYFGERPLLILFVLPIILSAILGGMGPGLLSTLLAAVSSAYYMSVSGIFSITNASYIVQWLILVVDGLLVTYLSGQLLLKNEKLHKLATIDELTSLFNRRHFIALVNRELARTERYSSTFSMLMIDIDHFKAINDTHGHQTGDVVLQQLGQLCRDTLREIDVPGRIGGEEFAVLLPQTGADQALEVAERLRTAISNAEFSIEQNLILHVEVSIGVVTMVDTNISVDDLLNQADTALYQAKRTGRNRVCVFRHEESMQIQSGTDSSNTSNNHINV